MDALTRTRPQGRARVYHLLLAPRHVRSVQQVGGVEEHFLDALALLTSEPRHTESLTRQLARTLSPTFEIPAAGAATMSEMVVDLAERRHRNGERRRRPGSRPGEATQARSTPSAPCQREHRGGHRNHQEELRHARWATRRLTRSASRPSRPWSRWRAPWRARRRARRRPRGTAVRCLR